MKKQIDELLEEFFEYVAKDGLSAEVRETKTMSEIVRSNSYTKKIAMQLLGMVDEYSPSWEVIVLDVVRRNDFSPAELMAMLSKYDKGFFDWQTRGSFLGLLCRRKDISTKKLLQLYKVSGLDVQNLFAIELTKRKDISLKEAKKIFESHKQSNSQIRMLWGKVLAQLVSRP